MPDPTAITVDVDPDLEPGQQVGEYVVERKLGEGAFGSVFRGEHPLIGKQVAIKVLARKFSVDPEMVSRFVAEAKAVNQIRHRHIIDIFSFGQLTDGRSYYVMEFLDGETLDALITRQGKLPLEQALPILKGIARALDAAHAKGIAHRDLKAENIFLATDGGGVFPKLLDFGIAKLLSPDDNVLKHKTRTGTPVGTPLYMSPEQCRGRDVDHRTDLYAFGVLAYLLLTGQFPHDAEDFMSILMRQITEHPEPPTAIAPELPSGVDDAIGWLLAKDPADRPSSLREAMAVLEQAARTAGIAIATDTWDVPSIAHAATRPPNTSLARASGLEKSTPPLPVASSKRPFVLAGIAVIAVAIVLAIVKPWAEPEPVAVVSIPSTPIEPVKPPPPKPPKPVVVEAQTVIVNVTGVPEGTEVLVGGMTVGAAPGPVQLPRDPGPLVLVFKADGYKLESKTVTPDRDQAIEIKLKKKSATGGAKSTRDDIIDNPFRKNP